ncbi:MAG: hypothetical protein ACLPN1_18425 [Dissulfurispiraceae bacterium]
MYIKDEDCRYFESQDELTIGEKIKQQILLHYETYIDLKKDPRTKPIAKHLARIELVQAQYIAGRALEQLDKMIAEAGD